MNFKRYERSFKVHKVKYVIKILLLIRKNRFRALTLVK